MARFHISQIAVNQHHAMYDELIKSVAGGIVDLGHTCSVATNDYMDGAINILIGSTIFASRHLGLTELLRGKPYIVYQLEQLDNVHGLLGAWPEYKELLSNATWIWDYAAASAKYLRDNGLSRVTCLPPGFHRCLETFRPAAAPDIDVLFFGTPHPRRLRLFEALNAAGLKTTQFFGTYGEARNSLIARAKIVLNVHAWDNLNVLETVRLSLLLANRCFVISETCDDNPYGDGVVYADYDVLVPTSVDYLQRPREERDAIAARGYAAIRRLDIVELVRPVLSEYLGAP